MDSDGEKKFSFSSISSKVLIAKIDSEIYSDFDFPKYRFGELSQSSCCETPNSCREKHKDEIKIEDCMEIDMDVALDEEYIQNCLSLSYSNVTPKVFCEFSVISEFIKYICVGKNDLLRTKACNFVTNFFRMHPPCHPRFKESYLLFAVHELKGDKLMPGLIQSVINNIHGILFNKNDSGINLDENRNYFRALASYGDKLESNNEMDCDDSNYMDLEKNPDVEPQHLTLADSLKRSFIVLKMLVKLLLDDFMASIVTNSFNLQKCIIVSTSKNKIGSKKDNLKYSPLTPIIIRSIWIDPCDGSPGTVNEMCTKVVSIFHETKSPEDKDILYKYISMIAEVFRIKEENPSTTLNSFDKKKSDSEIMYPVIGKHCEEFARSVARKFIEVGVINDDVIQSVCRLEPTWLKLLVSNRLINVLLKAKYSADLNGVIKILNDYCFCHQENKNEHQNRIPKCCPDKVPFINGYSTYCRGHVVQHLSVEPPVNIHKKSKNELTVNKAFSDSSDPSSFNKNKNYDVISRLYLCDSRNRITEPRKQFVNIRNSQGETLLHLACAKNDYKHLMGYLLVPGVSVNLTDNVGMTPLHEAVKSRAVKCVELLLNYKAKNRAGEQPIKLNVENKFGQTPLMLALRNKLRRISKMLICKGGPDVFFYINKFSQPVISCVENSFMPTIEEMDILRSPAQEDFLKLSNEKALLLIIMFQSYCDTYHLTDIYKKLKNSNGANKHTIRKGRKKLDVYLSHYKFKAEIFQMIKICKFLRKLTNNENNPHPIKYFNVYLGIDI